MVEDAILSPNSRIDHRINLYYYRFQWFRLPQGNMIKLFEFMKLRSTQEQKTYYKKSSVKANVTEVEQE